MPWRTTAPLCMDEDTKEAMRWLKSHNYIMRVTRRTDNLIVWSLH